MHVHVSVFSWKYCKQRYWFLHVRLPENSIVQALLLGCCVGSPSCSFGMKTALQP
ncbi:hypothetical protein EIKCOROL_01442 [Eikenella corrodens ATCC 23834]|uniref:Uncharacterized protein n=1 Tax=Eikenella corrodens ATCC 23834 TaxID=546274 RepID=C0DVQ2_EIKCO|nr:hypothetical protein EIKCOROL_01442 [Eikenella corrodens ATCC 23834]